jgi:hypothetical protein
MASAFLLVDNANEPSPAASRLPRAECLEDLGEGDFQSALPSPQRKEEEHDRERGQDCRHYESGGRKFHPMMEIHFHPRGQAKQEEKERGINQNYADPLFVVGFHQ